MKTAFVLAALLGSMLPAAQAAIKVYDTTLSGPAEAPPNASPGTGWARVTIDDVAASMRVEASFSGLLGNTTAAHIHCCTAAAGTGTAGVATVTPSFTGFPLGVTAGTMDHTYDMNAATGSWNSAFVNNNGGLPATAFAALLAGLDAGKAYFNVHTNVFTGGEIRGFLAPVVVTPPVPEPSTYALMLLGLAGIGAVARRRRG